MAAKFEAFSKLGDDDREALASISHGVQFVDARRDLISEGDRPQYVHVVLDGWAAGYKSLPDGKRQIVNFYVPGDVCDLNAWILRQMDHSICAVTRLKVGTVAPDALIALVAERPRLIWTLWRGDSVMGAIQREWTLNVGQRSAYQRLGHLLIELYLRLRDVGRAQEGRCDFPLTQNDLADATGLTAVHINRTLQELRRDGLIELERKQLHILDLKRMMEASMFNPNYLHLEGAASAKA